MTTARIGLRVLAGLVMPAVTIAAPSWSLTVGGASAAIVDTTAPMTLAIEARLQSDGMLVGGWDHGLVLIASPVGGGNAAWRYGDPSVEIVGNHASAGFTDHLGNCHAPGEFTLTNDAIHYQPSANSVLPGSPQPAIGVLDFNAYYGPFTGQVVETFHVTSLGILPVGDYVFDFGNGGQGYYMLTQPTGFSDNGQRTFGPNSVFTLTVPEPASALLLFAVLPLLRRRPVR